ncbi:MAG: Solute-binding protein [Burkholderiaceae bacterium]|nr:Solute-binding protein [Burkholderiaceae bacterium]
MKAIKTVAISALVVLGWCLSGAAAAQDKPIVLRYSNMFPKNDPLSIVAEEWGKEVEKRTHGAVQVKYYPGSTLTSPAQTYDSVVKGVVDVGNALMGYTRGRFPLMAGIWENPFEYPDGLTVTRLCNAAYEKFKPKELDEVQVMYFNAGPEAVLHTVKKPLVKLDDLKGMRFRSLDANAKLLASFGATAIAMPQPEVYDALSKGMLDGVASVYSNLRAFKTGDILKYTLELKGMAFTGTFVVAMNKEKWQSIPLESRKIIEQINKEWIDRHGRVHDQNEADGKKYAISKGMVISQISPEEQAKWNAHAQPFYDEYLANMKSKGLPGEEMLAFIRATLKNAGK